MLYCYMPNLFSKNNKAKLAAAAIIDTIGTGFERKRNGCNNILREK